MKHLCPDWDFLEIDEDSPEWECCMCSSPKSLVEYIISKSNVFRMKTGDFAKTIWISPYMKIELCELLNYSMKHPNHMDHNRIMTFNGMSVRIDNTIVHRKNIRVE